jgi:hypothetical protein
MKNRGFVIFSSKPADSIERGKHCDGYELNFLSDRAPQQISALKARDASHAGEHLVA